MARPIHRRYCTAEWEHERVAQSLSREEVEAKTRERYNSALSAGASVVQIRKRCLDDPFQSQTHFEQQLWLATRKKAAHV